MKLPSLLVTPKVQHSLFFVALAVVSAFALVETCHFSFWGSLSITATFSSMMYYVLFFILGAEPEEVVPEPEVAVDEIVGEYESVLQKNEETIKEQLVVIDEYEKIFDDQLAEIDCICGESTFQGLISPRKENIFQCEKCGEIYRVDVHYSPTLVSIPADNDELFEQLRTQVSSFKNPIKMSPDENS